MSRKDLNTYIGTEIAVKGLKDYFEKELSNALNLTRVSSPMFVTKESGLNDDLNGVERAVAFDIPSAKKDVQIVHSLAKWKRDALHRYGFNPGEGLYTDMNAIRRDEDLGPLHSVYVDQWDWERILTKEDRNLDFLQDIVKNIYDVFKKVEKKVTTDYPEIKPILPEEITFITTQELYNMYPDKTPKERENAYAKEKKAYFLMQIGGELNGAEKHDGRAADYDDWKLNGDIIFYNPVSDLAIELSSMGIRVDSESMKEQLKIRNDEHKLEYQFHKAVINNELPLTIGGGIGQSRICMYFLRKQHIGEVQAGVWSKEIYDECAKKGIKLL